MPEPVLEHRDGYAVEDAVHGEGVPEHMWVKFAMLFRQARLPSRPLHHLEDPLPRHPEQRGGGLEMMGESVLRQLCEQFRGDWHSPHRCLLPAWPTGPDSSLDQVLLLGRDQDMLLAGIEALQSELQELAHPDAGLPHDPEHEVVAGVLHRSEELVHLTGEEILDRWGARPVRALHWIHWANDS